MTSDASAEDVLFFDVVARSSSLTEAAREFGVLLGDRFLEFGHFRGDVRGPRRVALTLGGEGEPASRSLDQPDP